MSLFDVVGLPLLALNSELEAARVYTLVRKYLCVKCLRRPLQKSFGKGEEGRLPGGIQKPYPPRLCSLRAGSLTSIFFDVHKQYHVSERLPGCLKVLSVAGILILLCMQQQARPREAEQNFKTAEPHCTQLNLNSTAAFNFATLSKIP